MISTGKLFGLESTLRYFEEFEYLVESGACKVNSFAGTDSRSSDLSAIKLNSIFPALTSRCDFNLIALDNTLHTNVEILDYPLSMLQVYVSMVLIVD